MFKGAFSCHLRNYQCSSVSRETGETLLSLSPTADVEHIQNKLHKVNLHDFPSVCDSPK